MCFGCYDTAERVGLCEDLLDAMRQESIAGSLGNQRQCVAEQLDRLVHSRSVP
jgi:hypothetical protein